MLGSLAVGRARSYDGPVHPDGQRRFSTTRWSLVLAAGAGEGEAARVALAELCRLYWYPVYAFVRRGGKAHEDALDLTQEFFARLIERGDVASADQDRGRFRSWLLGALKHFLANEWDRATAQKRDVRRLSSIDAGDAETRYLREPSHAVDPEHLYHRRFALSLLERTLARLGEECATRGKADLFEQVKGLLVGDEADGATYASLAQPLATTAGALKVSVHRLRRRYGDLLRGEIAETVGSREEIADEIDFLLSALSLPEA